MWLRLLFYVLNLIHFSCLEIRQKYTDISSMVRVLAETKTRFTTLDFIITVLHTSISLEIDMQYN